MLLQSMHISTVKLPLNAIGPKDWQFGSPPADAHKSGSSQLQ